MNTGRARMDRRTFLRLGAGSAITLGAGCAYNLQPVPAKPPDPDTLPVIPPLPSKRVWAFSDVHFGFEEDGRDGSGWMRGALADLGALGTVEYALVLGDIAHNGRRAELTQYASIRDASAIPAWFELIGNHEYFDDDIAGYYSIVNPRTSYAVLDGNLLYVFISDEVSGIEGNISAGTFLWLQRLLADNGDKNCIVCSHQCVFGTVRGSTSSNRYIYPAAMISYLLDTYMIDLWLCGHQHYDPYAVSDIYDNGKTLFINVASLNHAYGTGKSESVLLYLTENSRELIALRRVHDTELFEPRFAQTVRLRYPLRLASPVILH
jgi:hypothetical protein